MIRVPLRTGLVVVILAAAALIGGCAVIADLVDISPIGAERPPAEGPIGGSPTMPGAAEVVMEQAMEHFEGVQTFSFRASAIHEWEHEGRLQEWIFVGEGAYEAPGRFFSRMEGPADADLRLFIDGEEIIAYDSRGQVADPTTAFGGPGMAASPFTTIAYLRNHQQVAGLEVGMLGGESAYVVRFVPNLASVAALDAGQASELAQVRDVEALVWIDPESLQVRQERVTVTYTEPNGSASTVEMTIRFEEFDRPVRIEQP